ncbi:MAG TPA: hypothetical protein VGX78_18620, partial [Pirellulales bacterium]|nr:hypothetical protein [Pirellulales bacterium]
ADPSAATWSAALDEVAWKRGKQELEVTLRTDENPPRVVRRAATIDYQPGAPAIEMISPREASSDSKGAKLVVSARVRPYSRRHARLDVTLVHAAGGDEPFRQEWKWKRDGELAVEQELVLVEGRPNQITLSAVNADAPEQTAARETSRAVRVVHFEPPRKPRIDLVATGGNGRRSDEIAEGKAGRLVVNAPSLRLDGRIAAESKLSMAGWRWDGEDDWRPLTNFAAGRKNEWEIHEPIELSKPLPAPQLHRLTFRAEAEGGTWATFDLEIEYDPLAPQLSFTGPPDDTRLVEQDDRPQEVTLSAAWDPPADRQRFEIEVQRNGVPLAGMSPERDDRRDALTVKAPLVRGPNVFTLRAFNAWGSETQTDARRMWLGGVPRIVGQVTAAERPPEQPWVDLEFLVDSAKSEPLTGLSVRGLAIDLASAEEATETEEGLSRWRVKADRVPLEKEGRNRIEVQARNAYGWSKPARCDIELEVPPPPKATLEITEPANGLPVVEPRCRVAFVVRSPSSLARVEVSRESQRKTTTVYAADVAQQSVKTDRDGQGVEYRLHVDTEIELPSEGSYHLKVLAENAGGVRTEQRTVTYVVPPMRLAVDALEPLDGAPGATLRAAKRGGRYEFTKPASSGVMRLRGSLEWTSANGPPSAPGMSIEVRVNGYRQETVVLGAVDGARKQSWQVRLCLDRDDNQVDVELLGLPRDQSDRRELDIACREPNGDRRLYVLVVGVGSASDLEKQADDLKRQALLAVGADLAHVEGNRFSTPVFKQGWTAPPRVKTRFDRQQLLGYISYVNEVIRTTPKDSPRTDLFLLYYRGGQSGAEGGRPAWSKGPADDLDSSAISNETLSNLFRATPGAQLVLLDVQGDLPTEQTDVRHGSLRYVWLGKKGRPADASLLVAFEQAAKKATTLDEICREIENHRKQRFPGDELKFEPQFPDSFRKLVLLKP